MVQRVKYLLAMKETWVQSLGREDTLEKEMATNSGTLAWKIPWTEKGLGGNNLRSGIRPGFGCGLCHFIAVSLLMRFLIPLSLSFFFGKGILQVTLEGYSDC